MEFFRQEYWSGLPFPPPQYLPNRGIEPRSPALAGGFFTTGATWEALSLVSVDKPASPTWWWWCSVVQSCPTLRPWGLQHTRLKRMSIESVMPSNHLIFCHPLLLPSIFSSIKVFPYELALRIRWPKYCSFSLGISPSNEYSGLISFRMDQFDLLAVQGTLESSPTPQF